MPDWKYHVTSLVAVFLALGIGIAVGSMVVGERAVLDQQRNMLAGLEVDLAALREANARLRAEVEVSRRRLEDLRALGGRTLPALVAGRLAGTNIVVVAEEAPDAEGLRRTLSQAGAVISSWTELKARDLPWPALATSFGLGEGPPWQRTAAALGERLGREIALGEETLLARGGAEGWLGRQGEYGRGTGALIVLLGARTAADRAAEPLFVSLTGYWRENWGPVVVASAAGSADLSAYQKAGASVVGNIGDPWAQAAVVAALVPR